MTPHLDAARLFACVDGLASQADRAHLEVCAACRQAVAEKRALQQALREATPRPPGPQRLRAQAELLLAALPPPAASSMPPWRRWTALASAAAAGALAVLVGHALLSGSPAAPELTRAPAPASASAASNSAPAAVVETLPDPLETPGPGDALEPPSSVAAQAPPVREPGHPGRAEAPGEDEKISFSSELQQDPAAPLPSAAERIEELLAQIEQAPDPLPMLQELTPLLRVAARQLLPEQLEVLARRIASLAVAPPADEAASVLACETGLLARRYPTAVQLCEDYLDAFPRGLRAREVALWTATAARVQLDDCQRALPHYDRALTFSGILQSYNDAAYLGRARCRLQQGDAAGARADLDLFLFKSPERRRDRGVRELLDALRLAP